MEAIEKLRKSLKDCTNKAGVEPNQFDTYWITAKACDVLIDEIEREIAECYIPLPVDADGVPWTQDDDVFVDSMGSVYRLHRLAWNPGVKQWHLLDQNNRSFFAKGCRHVKERTIEDVLTDFGEEWLDATDSNGLLAKYADELRELVGGE